MKPAHRTLLLWFAGAMVGLKLVLVSAQPVVAIGPAGHDDALYLYLAESILDGNWLGNYSQFTLMKGAMYPLWIAGLNLVGLPLPLAQHLLYLAGCILVVRAIPGRDFGPGLRIALFFLLWWNPMTYEQPVLGRVLRQNLYTPVTLLLFAAAFALESRRDQPRTRRLAWGALLGLALAALWMIREESIWVVPSLALLVGSAGVAAWKTGRTLRPLVAPMLAACVCGGGLLAGVSSLNAYYYGWFGTVEFRAPAFLAAYGALQRVKAPERVPYTPVTRAARESIYPVSPAFARLQPFLEGDLGTFWAGACEGLTRKPRSEREIAGGWFMWALRDAVIAAEQPKNAREALAAYARIAEEVNRACDTGLLPARRRSDTLAPRLELKDAPTFLRILPAYLDYFVTFRGFDAYPSKSMGTADLLKMFSRLTHWHLAPSPEAPELDDRAAQQRERKRITLLQGIGKGMRWVGASVAGLGFLAWAWEAIRMARQRRLSPRWIAATSVLGACLAVVLINALVDTFSFPNRSPGALAQAYPLLLLFGGLALGHYWSTRFPSAGPAEDETSPSQAGDS